LYIYVEENYVGGGTMEREKNTHPPPQPTHPTTRELFYQRKGRIFNQIKGYENKGI
jgi:hypothetical protein